MRRGSLLVLLALALPTAALASSADFDTGKFVSGTWSGTFTAGIHTTEVGSLDTISIDTGALTKLPASNCPKGDTCFDFSGGSVDVVNRSRTVFTDGLEGGLTMKGNTVVAISASLMPNGTVKEGTAVETLVFSGHKITSGSSDVSFASNGGAAVPEPSTLGLIGTGLIGLAGAARRKLKLST